MKLYYNIPEVNLDHLSMSYGNCMAPALLALDRALTRALPPSSDTLSPKLSWWDKSRYMLHGRLSLRVAHKLELKYLVFDPRDEDNVVLLTSSDFSFKGYTELVKKQGHDFKAWDWAFTNMYLGSFYKGKHLRWLVVPRMQFTLSMAFKCESKGDHYTQLHHSQASPLDMYAKYRATGLVLGLSFVVERLATTDYNLYGVDYEMKNRCPCVELCVTPSMQRLFQVYRGFFPPEPASTTPSLGRLLTKINLFARCARAHLLWAETPHSHSALLYRANMVDSCFSWKKVLKGEGVKGNINGVKGNSNGLTGKNPTGKNPTGNDQQKRNNNMQDDLYEWMNDAVLCHFVGSEGFVLKRSTYVNPKPKHDELLTWGDEYGVGDEYVYGIGFPMQPFVSSPAMRLTLGMLIEVFLVWIYFIYF